MDGCHLVLHERCQWDLWVWRGATHLNSKLCASPELFFLAEAETHLSHSPAVCAFLKIGNKRNRLCLRLSDSSLEIRSFFYLLHRRLRHYDENSNKLCSHALKGAGLWLSFSFFFPWVIEWFGAVGSRLESWLDLNLEHLLFLFLITCTATWCVTILHVICSIIFRLN